MKNRSWVAILVFVVSVPTLAQNAENKTRAGETPNEELAKCERVMMKDMKITFTNAEGKMTITAGEGFERHYTWAGDTRTVVMQPRNERWFGSLGMYNPGYFVPGQHEPWKEHDRINRFLTEEGQRHFTEKSEAMRWLEERTKFGNYVYNDSGLVINMERSIPPPDFPIKDAPGTLTVEVWQIYINGKKPTKLEGSKNNAISVEYPPAYDMHAVEPPEGPVNNFR